MENRAMVVRRSSGLIGIDWVGRSRSVDAKQNAGGGLLLAVAELYHIYT
jgi:hypothetical protein